MSVASLSLSAQTNKNHLDAYPGYMSKSRSRNVRPTQLVTLIGSFFALSGLMGTLVAGVMIPAVGSVGVVAKTFPTVFDGLPSEIRVVAPAEESLLLDADGGVIARFYDKRRILVPSDKIADVMKQAIVAIEDKRFYDHHGVDPEGMARALVNNLSDGGKQGASTITQQFVRNSIQERGYLEGDAELAYSAVEQTTQRKLREIKYALTLEKSMSKDEILAGYLNIAPFGPITYGVEAASQLYFSHSAAELNWLEAALLSGLVQSPVDYNPLTNPEAAETRRNTVLMVMRDEGIITEEDYQNGINTPVANMLKPNETPQGCLGASSMNAYFCDLAIRQFLDDPAFGDTYAKRERLLKTGGLTIRTTLTPALNAAAYNAVTSAIPVNDESGLDSAIVSVEPGTGKIMAMAQNTDYGLEEGKTMSNYSANGIFQVGSTFKVFPLLQWLKEGNSAYAAVGRANRVYANGEFSCGGAPIYTDTYDVEDLPGKDGTFNAISATGLSVNQAFINMASRVDFCQIFQTAADFGVTDANGEVIKTVPANILGSASTSPLTMANAFAAIAHDGQLCTPQALTLVTDRSETVLKEYTPQCKEVITPTVARQAANILGKSTARYYNATRLAGGRPFGAKSGTTDYSANTWLTGFTPQLATSVWVGRAAASQQPVRNIVINGNYYDTIYGETFVGRNIWAPYMDAALEGTEVIPLPDVFIGNVPAPRPAPRPGSSNNNNSNNQTPQSGR